MRNVYEMIKLQNMILSSRIVAQHVFDNIFNKTTTKLRKSPWNMFTIITKHSSSSCSSSSTFKELTSDQKSKLEQLAKSLTSSSSSSSHVGNDGNNQNNNLLTRRFALSKAITLIESTNTNDIIQGNYLLNFLLVSNHYKSLGITDPTTSYDTMNNNSEDGILHGNGDNHHQRSVPHHHDGILTAQNPLHSSYFRVGIAGSPGAGKSTFIEQFGMYVLDHSHSNQNTISKNDNDKDNDWFPSKLATLCIDPSSSITGGSILGDKTRMLSLSRHPKAYVRPSSSKGILGGLSIHTNDAATLCQAAGYDFIIIESVGIGQSEIDISQSVDMVILIVAPGCGDGLQGVKKGILEVADLIVVNKADGTLMSAAQSTAAEYKGATPFLRSRGIHGWETTPVMLVSSITKDGIKELYEEIRRFRRIMIENGELVQRRKRQSRYWMWKNMQHLIEVRNRSDPNMKGKADAMQEALDRGVLSPRAAAWELLELQARNLPPGR